MSEFKVGDRVRMDGGHNSGVVSRVAGALANVLLDAACTPGGVQRDVLYYTSQLEHAEPEAPSPDYEQHAIDHAVKAMRNAEVRTCNIASHEDLAADVHIMEREARKLKEEIRDLKAENSDLRRRIEKLERLEKKR